MKTFAVVVSVGRHPVSGTARYSRNDAAALALGLALGKQHGARVDVLHAGDAQNPALREYLALGAAQLDVLDMTSASGSACVEALAARLRGYDLVLTGTRAEDGIGSGMLPYHLAASLALPLLNDAVDVDIADGVAQVRQFLPKGLRRRLAASLPVLITVHPLANVAPRFAYARIGAGRIDSAPPGASPGMKTDAEAGVLPASAPDEVWQWRPVRTKPVRLAAAEKRGGHARMHSATTTESRGGSVVNDGSPVEKAQVILAYLREHRLVEY
ncbi:MAG: electron transfer flavoprotein subunit beta/FixA family protein [Janthinobacterium lividum]